MGRGKLFWIVLVIVLILLAVLYGFVIRKRALDSRVMDDLSFTEDGVSGANSEAGARVNDFGGDVGGNSGSSGGGPVGGAGSSGGGSGGDVGDVNVITPPPMIPEVGVE